MEGKSVLQQQDSDSKITKKFNSHKPLILLRRNSSGLITAKTASPGGGLPRLKSVGDIKVSPQVKIKTEGVNNSYFITEKVGTSKRIVTNTKPEVKKENAGSIPVQFSKQVKKELHVEQPVSTSLQGDSECNRTSSAEYRNNFSPFSIQCQVTSPNTVLQHPNIAVQQPLTAQAYAPPQQYQKVQINNPHLNSLLPFPNEQVQPQLNVASNRYVYPSSVLQKQNAMLDNRQLMFLQPNSAPGVVSQGAIIHSYPNPMFQMQSSVGNFSINNSPNVLPCNHSSFPLQGTDLPSDDSLTNITWLGKMGMNNFMPVPLERERKSETKHENPRRPPYSYMALIQFAINSSPSGRMTLRQIYQWIEDKFPYFKTAKPDMGPITSLDEVQFEKTSTDGNRNSQNMAFETCPPGRVSWKNSIRHNLSLHDLFVREVTNGSKASFWTLRPDLNIRPLTLDSVGTSPAHSSMWSFPTNGDLRQKTILPRLPYCPQPYVLLPVPLLRQNPKESASVKVETTEVQGQEGSSSLLVDSGYDASHSTPGTSSKTFSNYSDSSLILPNDSGVSFLKSEKKTEGPFPLLSQACGKSGKRARKEPLRTLNDSLNSSLQFVKEEINSPPNPSFPSTEKSWLRKGKPKEYDTGKPMIVGLSEESFSELLNDLGSPFKSYLTQEQLESANISPDCGRDRKRRRSWGSPEASGSGMEFQQKLKAANENTPVRHHMRRVKSDLVGLTQALKGDDGLPTSTPLNKEKWKKVTSQRKMSYEDFENKENLNPKKCDSKENENWRLNENTRETKFLMPPSPIPNSCDDSDIESEFFKDIIGSVFKTPDKQCATVRHLDRLSPDRVPLSSITGPLVNSNGGPSKEIGQSYKIADTLPVLSAVGADTDEPLNTSFSKLLEISGGFGRLTDVDLNLSWPNFPNM